jgi:hypothetical protein
MKNKPFTEVIKGLDPEKDWHRIAFLLTFHCFPWDMEKSLEFALFRTFAVPRISKLLLGTGEFIKRARKRYDDTELILYEILENGMDSERGKKAISLMNAMHGRFSIPNEDYLYVLSTFIFEPIRWMEKYGWRPFTEQEKNAIFINYLELAKRMDIIQVPESLGEFEKWNKEYEKIYFRFDIANRQIAEKTIAVVLGNYLPTWLFWLGKPFVISLMDDPLRESMGYKKPLWIIQKTTCVGMMAKSSIQRILPEPKFPKLGTRRKRPTYPKGYELTGLGTCPYPLKGNQKGGSQNGGI